MPQRIVPHGQMRAVEVDGRPVVRMQIIRYNVVDSFKWLWLPGCFNRAIDSRMPTFAWAHTWSDPIGRAKAVEYDAEGPILDFYLDDFDAVPRARQAYAQVGSGTIDDCSIGFNEPVVTREPTDEERQLYPGVQVVCLEADLDEVSLVLRGAVPGAKVLATRSRSSVISAEQAGVITAQLAAGTIDLQEALTALKEQSVEAPQSVADEGADDETQGEGASEEESDDPTSSGTTDAEGEETTETESAAEPVPELTDAELEEIDELLDAAGDRT